MYTVMIIDDSPSMRRIIKDMINSIDEFKYQLDYDKSDVILIDTAGRSQKNMEDIKEIKKYISCIKSKCHIALVISATTKYKDLIEIFENFSTLNYNSLIVTKIDETNNLGGLISAIMPLEQKLHYITYGQSVPEDISGAKTEKVLDLVLKGVTN